MPIYRQYKNISNNHERSEVLDTPYKKRSTEWNFVPLALRRLLPDLRAKLACSARSDNALRSGAMLAHEENSNASAYSVCPPRNFCFTDYSTIMNNAARTILTKVCKNRLFQISFWLCFVFGQSECLTVAIIFMGSTRDKKPRKHKVLV